MSAKRWACFNASCRQGEKFFEFAAVTRKCPKCGSTEADCVSRVLDHHFLVKDNATGTIKGDKGMYRIACNAKKTMSDVTDDYEMCTGEAHNANCPECMKTADYREALQAGAKHEDYLSLLSPQQLALLET